ncbi:MULTISPECIES: helix-turn-helix domain-containing protein [unclassified Methylosinus]|jgi:predicted XRE-type DNA-binding protein|uniref:helix-turn-helix domain-containing protein n=1 Tax=unclassified Methylosinus TaxID=2624500 RepID=UPI000A042653|nr:MULTISPECIES: helix-turn-helix transcriptional regulator [unclassified Methylosinus]
MSFLLKLDPRQRKAGRFIGRVRDEIIKAFTSEKQARGLTQEQVAQALGIHRSQVNRILKGEENLTLRTISDLAWALDREIVFRLEKPESVPGQNHGAEQPVVEKRHVGIHWPRTTVTHVQSTGPTSVVESAL